MIAVVWTVNRFSIALIELEKEKLKHLMTCYDRPALTGDLINCIRSRAQNCYDVLELKRVAFYQIKILRRKQLATRRAFYLKQLLSNPIIATSYASPPTPETPTQWLRRRSCEIFSLTKKSLLIQTRQGGKYIVVVSQDQTKVGLMNDMSRKVQIQTIDLMNTDQDEISGEKIWSPLKDLELCGIGNKGKRLLFTQTCENVGMSHAIETFSKSALSLQIVKCSQQVVEAFYLESSEEVFVVQKTGLVSKINLIEKDEYEKINLCAYHMNGKQKVLAAALDSSGNDILWVLLVSSPSPAAVSVSKHKRSASDTSSLMTYEDVFHQIFVLDLKSLDIFSQIDLTETEMGSCCKLKLCASSGIAILAMETMKSGVAKTSISLIMVNSFMRQLIVRDDDSLIDMKTISGRQAQCDGSDQLKKDGRHGSSKSPEKESAANDSVIVAILFNSGKLFCLRVQTSGGYLLSHKESLIPVRDAAQVAAASIVRIQCDSNGENSFKVTLLLSSSSSSSSSPSSPSSSDSASSKNNLIQIKL